MNPFRRRPATHVVRIAATPAKWEQHHDRLMQMARASLLRAGCDPATIHARSERLIEHGGAVWTEVTGIAMVANWQRWCRRKNR